GEGARQGALPLGVEGTHREDAIDGRGAQLAQDHFPVVGAIEAFVGVVEAVQVQPEGASDRVGGDLRVFRMSPVACWCSVFAAELFSRDFVEVDVLDGPRGALAGSRLVTVENDSNVTGIERVADVVEELL